MTDGQMTDRRGRTQACSISAWPY